MHATVGLIAIMPLLPLIRILEALNFLVGILTPKGTSEVDQRIGAALGEWGPYLGGIFHTKFG